MASVNSSKSHRFVDFLPSVRPSFLSLVVLFACGCLWIKNETTNERPTALESRINMSPVEVLVKTGCSAMENSDRTTLNPKEESAKNVLKKLQRPVDEVKLKDTSALDESGESRTKAKPRNRRQVLTVTSAGISIHDVRKEISRQFEQLMPTKYCKSTEKVCPVGPPGLPGPTGVRRPRGRRGPKGKKGPQGLKGPLGKSGQRGMTGPAGLGGEKGDKGEPGPKAVQGPPGSPGKTGMTGLTGPRGDKGGPGPKGMPGPPGRTGKTGMTELTGPTGDKGDKGGPGTKGMPGPPGRPGESVSTPQLIISLTDQTKDEKSNSVIYCTVKGNPTPSVEWRFKSRKLYSGAKYLIKEGELVVRNLNYSDAGQYTCVARNILGTSEASGNLKVRGLPILTKRPSSLVSKMESATIQETCQAEGYPPPKLTWIRLVMPLPAGKTEVKEANCDCWRSRSRSPRGGGWGYTGSVDAIDFQTNGDVILSGYRLWGVSSGSTIFQVTIRLYRGSNLIAEKSGSYATRSSVKTFEVHFSQRISIRAGVTHTATARITTTKQSFYIEDGMASASCSGVTVTFKSSSKDPNDSNQSRGQIPALIFRSSQC